MSKKIGTSYNEGNFKFLDYFDVHMVKKIVDRNAAARFAMYGLPDEALREGVDVLSDKGKEWKGQSDLDTIMESGLNTDLIKGCGHERAFAHNWFTLHGKKDDLHLINVNETTPGYEAKYGRFGKPLGLKFELNIADNSWNNGQSDKFSITKEAELRQTHFVMLRPSRENLREGYSRLMPIWDNCIALGAVGNNSTNYLIRVGSGIKIMYLDENQFNDPDTRDLVEGFLQNLNSTFSYTMVPRRPKDLSGESELQIYTGEGAINFQEIFDINAAFIATDLNVPTNRIKGLYIGETTGAEVTRSMYYQALQMIQQDYKMVYKWLFTQLAEKKIIESLPDNFQIDFRYKYELSEMDAVTIETTRIQNAIMYMNSFGLDPNAALEAAGLEKLSPFKSKEELDKSKQAMFDMNNPFNQGQDQKQGQDQQSNNANPQDKNQKN